MRIGRKVSCRPRAQHQPCSAHLRLRRSTKAAFSGPSSCCTRTLSLNPDPSPYPDPPALEALDGGGVLGAELLLQRPHVLRRQAAAPVVAQLPHLARRLPPLVLRVPVRRRQRPRSKYHPGSGMHTLSGMPGLRSTLRWPDYWTRIFSLRCKVGTCWLHVLLAHKLAARAQSARMSRRRCTPAARSRALLRVRTGASIGRLLLTNRRLLPGSAPPRRTRLLALVDAPPLPSLLWVRALCGRLRSLVGHVCADCFSCWLRGLLHTSRSRSSLVCDCCRLAILPFAAPLQKVTTRSTSALSH